MKIYLTNMESLYSSISGSGKTAAKKNPGAVQEMENSRADISDVSSSHDEIDELKSAAVQDTEKGTDPDKLRALRDEIASGTYSVSSSDISAAMLKFNGNENN